MALTGHFWLAQKPAMETGGSTVDLGVKIEFEERPESDCVLQIAESESSDPVESTLALVESSKGRGIDQLPEVEVERREGVTRGRISFEEKALIPIKAFHPSIFNWVIQKALEIKHCAGITSGGFEEEFVALLVAIDAEKTIY